MILVPLVVFRRILVLQVREGQSRAGREKPGVFRSPPFGTRCYLRYEPPRPAYHLAQLLVRAPEEDGRVFRMVHIPQRLDDERVSFSAAARTTIQDLELGPAVKLHLRPWLRSPDYAPTRRCDSHWVPPIQLRADR